MTVGLHAPVHLSLQLLLTPHAVGRDAISKGDEGQDPPAHEDASAHAPSGAPTEDRRPARPVPGRHCGPGGDVKPRPRRPAPQASLEAAPAQGRSASLERAPVCALVLGLGPRGGRVPQQDTETLCSSSGLLPPQCIIRNQGARAVKYTRRC